MNDFKKHLGEAKASRNRIEDIINAKRAPEMTPQTSVERSMPVKITVRPVAPVGREVVKPTPKPNLTSTYKPDSNYTLFLKAFFLGLGIIVLMIVVGTAGYKIFSHVDFGKSTQATDTTLQDVGKLVELPVGEDPTIATITDLEPLKKQEFFKDAQIGDKVIIYSTSSKAILYRPSEKRVLVVAPINK